MLKISRPGISADEITPLPLEKRFLKLPIENYLKLLNVTPNRVQNALINAVNHPDYRFITACVGRRVGKTYISNIILQTVALYPGTTVLIISPDYSLSSISWDLQRSLLDHFDIERKRDNAKDRVIELDNGSMIRIASVSRVDSAVGRSYDLIVFDEAALNPAGGAAFNVSLLPTLDKSNSKCIFISTPRGDNWFKVFFDRGFSKDPNDSSWISIEADYHENPRLDERAIAEARAAMSHAEFEQEMLARFVTFEGQVWSLREEAIQDLTDLRVEIARDPDRYEIIAGLDLGFRDPTAMCVIVVFENAEGLKEYKIIDEYFAVQRSTEEHAQEISRLFEKWNIEYIFIDAAAAQVRFDLAATYDIPTINALKDVLLGIGSVGAVVDNNRLTVHEDCLESIYALRNYKWKGDVVEGAWKIETQKPEHNRASHMADALRYAIYTYERSVGGVG